jgi:hypothetical protein
MSAITKLVGFAVELGVVFGAAALAGGAVGPLRDETETAKPHEGGIETEGHGGEAAQPVRGLAVSDRGLTLQLARTRFQRDTRSDLAFRIVDRRGRTVRDFDIEHTKRMHVIVVRRDMTGFQHLHPTQAADGTWSVPVALRDAGSYRVFADFSANGTAHTLADDLTVDGEVRSRDLPAPAGSVDVDGLRVTLGKGASRAGTESELAFSVTRNGKPVQVEEYLGARGHLVALRQGDLAFLHVHPDEDSLKFMATFPTAGAYRLFLQFKVDGRVHTAAFTQEVSR